MTDPRMTTTDAPVTDDDGPCTTCDDTGVTIQTERPCSCEAGDQYRAKGDAPVTVEPDWLNADVCIDNMQIAYQDATEDEDETPVDTTVSAGDLGVLIGLAQYAVRHRLAALASAPAEDGVEASKVLDDIVPLSIASTWDEAERRSIVRAMEAYALARPHSAVAPAGDGVEDDAALLADANSWYSQAQVDDMERSRDGALACKCGDYPRPSGNHVRPDDGWRSMWCQGCMEHVVGWCASEAEAVEKWNAQRTTELTAPPAAALARPRAAVGERSQEDAIEAVAQFLHDEGGFDNAWTDRTWPEHPDDTGQRDGGWVKIVPTDVQAHFRDVARRMFAGRLALQSPPAKVDDILP